MLISQAVHDSDEEVFNEFKEQIALKRSETLPEDDYSSRTLPPYLTKTDVVEKLFWACASDGIELLESIISRYSVDVNGIDFSQSIVSRFKTESNRSGRPERANPLLVAASMQSVRVTERLHQIGANVHVTSANGVTALHAAVSPSYPRAFKPGRCAKLIRILIDYGADVKQKDIYGETCLHDWARLNCIVKKEKCTPILAVLIAKGADMKSQNKAGETVLHILANSGCESGFKDLCNYLDKTQVEDILLIQDSRGSLPMHLAASRDNTAIFELMHAELPSPKTRTADGRSALHFAAGAIRHGTRVLSFLLDSLVDPFVRANDGSTAAHECVQALRRPDRGEERNLLGYDDSEEDSDNDRDRDEASEKDSDNDARSDEDTGGDDQTDSDSSSSTETDANGEPKKSSVAKNFLQAIEALRLKGCNLNAPRTDGKTPLHLLCEFVAVGGFCSRRRLCRDCRNYVSCMRMLLDRVAGVMSTDSHGQTPMHILFRSLYRIDHERYVVTNRVGIKSLKLILDLCAPSDLASLSFNKVSALGVAAIAKSTQLTLRLIELRADVDADDDFESDSLSPLQEICANGPSARVIAMALPLTRNLRQTNKHGLGLLHLAAGSASVCKTTPAAIYALIDAGIPVDLRSGEMLETPLMQAAAFGSVGNLEALLAKGANPSERDRNNWTAFTEACNQGSLAKAQALFQPGTTWDFVRCDERDEDFRSLYGTSQFWHGPLQLAAASGNNKLVEKILEWRRTGCERLETLKGPAPLWWSSLRGDTDILRTLIQEMADINAIEPLQGVSCLQIAAVKGNMPVMKVLLEAGCDFEAEDFFQRTAMIHATRTGNKNAIALLLEHSSRFYENEAASSGSPCPLNKAGVEFPLKRRKQEPRREFVADIMRRGDLDIVRMLYNKNVDMSAQSGCGCTPLLLAMISDQYAICALLLKWNVSTAGRTCAEHAVEQYDCFELAVLRPERTDLLRKLLDTPQWIALGESERRRRSADMLCLASIFGNIPAMKELLRHNVNPDWIPEAHYPEEDWRLPICTGVLSGNRSLFGEGRTLPLLGAIFAGQLDAASTLLAGGADVNRAS